MPAPPLILASASPRRRQLLQQIGLAHTVDAAHIDETRQPGEDPATYVQRLARTKAATVQARHPEATILAADTTVVLRGDVLNQPADRAEAARMLQRLAGHTHQVHTGVALLTPGWEHLHLETTLVTMTAIPPEELAEYLNTGDSYDKAGAYGIQGYAARWISRIEGDFFNVMGLPLAATMHLLRRLPG